MNKNSYLMQFSPWFRGVIETCTIKILIEDTIIHHFSILNVWYSKQSKISPPSTWVSYQIRKIAGCACAGNAGNVFLRRRPQRKPLVSDPGMHHGTCRDACRDRLQAVAGKTFPAFPAHAHMQFYVSGKRPMQRQGYSGKMPESLPSPDHHQSRYWHCWSSILRPKLNGSYF